MENLHAVHGSALEQAVISKNKEFLYTFLSLQEETQEKMVRELPNKSVVPLLETLAELFEKKEMRYEAILAIRSVLSWRRSLFGSLSISVQEKKEGEESYTCKTSKDIDALKKILMTINKEKVDLNKVYELKGRMAFIRDLIEERKEEKENVPVCREQ